MRLPRPRFARRRGTDPSTAPTATEVPTGEQPAAGQSLDGLRAWLAQLDRRLRLRSNAALLLSLAALAAGVVGILLALDARDNSATKEGLNEVRTRITEVEQNALQAAADDIEAFSSRISGLEGRIRAQLEQTDRNRSEIRVAGDDIEDLRRELADLSDRVADLESEVSNLSEQNAGGGGGNSGGT